ncbi:MAG TPA: chitobiase/beta-hexosaminidase C-terminal domain-containing protein, partial [Acidobacteriota bacterium]|nr:chitobiase/beta-hexosaminidase C-terminal domain-containing protein [Acidobacteriota bacterium]
GNLWTEYLKTPGQVEYQLVPRMLALAEIVWSRRENKNFDDFQKRLQRHYVRFDKDNVNYRIPEPAGLQNVILGNRGSARFDLRSQIDGGKIYYSTDGSEPTELSKIYAEPFEVSPKSNETMQVTTVVVNGAGRRSSIYAATIMRGPASASVDLNEDRRSGVNALFFQGNFERLAEIDLRAPTETSESNSISIGQFSAKTDALKKPFGAKFQAYIYTPKEEIYEFRLETDDNARLLIDGQKVVELDGIPSKTSRPGRQVASGIIALAKGFHRFEISYIKIGGDAALGLFWGVKGEGLRSIGGPELVY